MCCVLLYAMIIPHFNLDSSIVSGVELVSRLCRSTNRGVLRKWFVSLLSCTCMSRDAPGMDKTSIALNRLTPLRVSHFSLNQPAEGFQLRLTTTFGNQLVPTRDSLNYCPLRSSCVSP